VTGALRRNGPWAALVLAALLGRLLLGSRAALQAGNAAIARGAPAEGVRQLRRAAHLYVPLSPWTAGAYDALEAFAREHETRGQNDRALDAWRAVRGSALATRWVVIPYADRLARANRHIAHLMALQAPAPNERESTVQAREERHLALLSEDRAPEPAWVIVLAAGFALWAGALAHAARRGWSDDDVPQRRPLALAGAAGGVGVALFLLALARA
jgi:hypothetical protein